MNMEYRVRLPDHDWVVAVRHKLIPSVYAGIIIHNKTPAGQPDAVSYSGPTYVAIRSGKHSSSTAASHAQDFERLLSLESFDSITKTSTGEVKPVLMVSVDGGPDENPRYRAVIKHAVKTFTTHNLDFMVVFTNAPGRSAYNRPERRMAPLSRMLSGLILPHDHYGSHLDTQARTVDLELEKKNFGYAGQTLAEVWSSLTIDQEVVTAEYVEPVETEIIDAEIGNPGSLWYAKHVRESQYLLQISKCNDLGCCSEPRSKLRSILPTGFLPPPILLSGVLEAAEPLSQDAHYCPLFIQLAATIKVPTVDDIEEMPYDFYCNSIQNKLKKRICSTCSLYFATQDAMKAHKSNCHRMAALVSAQVAADTSVRRSNRIISRRGGETLIEIQSELGEPLDVEWVPDDRSDAEDQDFGPEDDIPLIRLISNVNEWSSSPWTLDNKQS